jgi:hypothetical protein
MNDIERYNFWHLEQDAFIKKQKEGEAILLWNNKRRTELDNAIKGLPTWDSLEKLFCEAIKNGRRLEI